ncbi:nuclear transport factor 2 family protein [Jongsikchunia kroppenstedtii]|uniref:nuclear transport factor 2 family protein n=1 Tax=Jongsikchunia kroppenstedtii TaxID=1121721 RepID=UPI00035F5D77|nr:nuclear transport factor 2 family protein [Jongsikchunia kroppenstedtii]
MSSVADRLDIADLVARYAHYVDRRDWLALAELFTADAELLQPDPPRSLEPARSLVGRDAILVAMHALDDIPVTQHAVLGTVIDFGGPDTATGWVTGQANHVTSDADKHRNLVWYLHYQDEYRHTPNGWRIARRAVHIDWIETRPVRLHRGTATD